MAGIFYGEVEIQLFCRLILCYFPVVLLRFFAFAVSFDGVALNFFTSAISCFFLRFSPVLTVSVFWATSSYDIELKTVEKGSNRAF